MRFSLISSQYQHSVVQASADGLQVLHVHLPFAMPNDSHHRSKTLHLWNISSSERRNAVKDDSDRLSLTAVRSLHRSMSLWLVLLSDLWRAGFWCYNRRIFGAA